MISNHLIIINESTYLFQVDLAVVKHCGVELYQGILRILFSLKFNQSVYSKDSKISKGKKQGVSQLKNGNHRNKKWHPTLTNKIKPKFSGKEAARSQAK